MPDRDKEQLEEGAAAESPATENAEPTNPPATDDTTAPAEADPGLDPTSTGTTDESTDSSDDDEDDDAEPSTEARATNLSETGVDSVTWLDDEIVTGDRVLYFDHNQQQRTAEVLRVDLDTYGVPVLTLKVDRPGPGEEATVGNVGPKFNAVGGQNAIARCFVPATGDFSGRQSAYETNRAG